MEKNAQEVLNGIEGYILEKLGISIDTTGDSKTFTIWSDEVEGRIDSPFYQPFIRNSQNNLMGKVMLFLLIR